MTLDRWLECACADADRRGLPDLKPLLNTLAQATQVLRSADWNDVAGAVRQQTDDRRTGGGGRPPQGAAQ